VGILAALLISYFFEVHVSPVFWVLCASEFITSLLFSGLSLSLNTVLSPIPAGIFAFMIQMLPVMVGNEIKSPNWYERLPALGAYYFAPAQMPIRLVNQTFDMDLLHPDYGLYCQVLGENFLYAMVVFVIACAVFSRREIPMR
jgi:hypothetical protein